MKRVFHYIGHWAGHVDGGFFKIVTLFLVLVLLGIAVVIGVYERDQRDFFTDTFTDRL